MTLDTGRDTGAIPRPEPPEMTTSGVGIPGFRESRFIVLAVMILAAAPFLLFFDTFLNPFVADDIDFIVRNPDVVKFAFPEGLGKLRWINKLSYHLNMAIHGTALPGYHLVNLVLHALAGVLIFFLFRKLLRDFAPGGSAREPDGTALAPEGTGTAATALAFAGALLFVVHPIHIQAVKYVFARSELWCAVFLFAALLVHAHRDPNRYGFGRGAAVAFFLLLALSTKERAFMFVPALILFDLLVRRGETPARRKRRWLHAVVPVSLVVILGLVNFYLGFTSQHQGAIGQGREVPEAVPYFWTEMVVRLHYLKLYIWPSDLSFDYNFTLRSSLTDPALLGAIAAHLAILGGTLLTLRREGRIAFGVFWWFLLVLPTSGLVPAALLMHEHWIYVSSFGFLLAVLVTVQGLLARIRGADSGSAGTRGRIAVRVALVALLVLAGVACVVTRAKSAPWKDPVELWRHASRYAPKRQWVWNNLGVALLEKIQRDPAWCPPERRWVWDLIGSPPPGGTPDQDPTSLVREAREHLERAEALGEPTSASNLNIGICYMEEGDLTRALERFDAARSISPERAEIFLALARVYSRMKKPFKAVDAYLVAAKLHLNTPELFLERAKIELRGENSEKALTAVKQGLRTYPRNRELKALLAYLEGRE